MPTFTETQLDYLQSKQLAESVLESKRRQLDFGQGYTFEIWFNRENAHPVYKLKGPSVDINEIPPVVLRRYYQAVVRLRDWVADRVADFPDFGDI